MPEQVSSFKYLEEKGLYANSTNTVTAALNIGRCSKVGFQVIAVSGTHSTEVVTLQFSSDPTTSNWVAGASATLAGAGINDNISTSMRYARLSVTTAEGGASVIDVRINAT